MGPDARERGEAGWWLGGWVGDSDQSRSGADRWGEGLAVHWSVELDGEDESCRVADMPAAGGQHELGLRYDWAANCRVGGAAQVSSKWPRQILVRRRSSAGAKLRRRVPMCHTCGHACGCFQALKGATRSALHETCVQFASTWPLLQSKFWKEKEIGDDIFRG